MTRIFFYHNLQERLGAACALVSKAYAQGKDFTLYIPDPERAQRVDRLLWTQPALGFLPHCRMDSPLAAETPVLITADLESEAPPSGHSMQRLLNLGDEVPSGFERYASVVEVVSGDEADRACARQRIRHYKECGCDIQFMERTGG
jgi:DNA polymerase-3 subunit chi